jgi:hypothetical protein
MTPTRHANQQPGETGGLISVAVTVGVAVPLLKAANAWS